MSRFSDKEKQLFWNLKFHAVLSTIFSQLTLTLNCYSAMVSSWRHVISPVPESKTHPNPAMTQHIRECSRNPPHPIYIYGVSESDFRNKMSSHACMLVSFIWSSYPVFPLQLFHYSFPLHCNWWLNNFWNMRRRMMDKGGTCSFRGAGVNQSVVMILSCYLGWIPKREGTISPFNFDRQLRKILVMCFCPSYLLVVWHFSCFLYILGLRVVAVV